MCIIDINRTLINKGFDITQLEPNGYVLTNGMLCMFNSLVILKHLKDNYCEELFTDKQSENINNLYNQLVV